MRLNKYIAESGLCSRREADRLIETGAVLLNGRRASMGDQVAPGDRVRVSGRDIAPREATRLVMIALNKPVGIVSTTDPDERANIVDFVNHPQRLFPIGRLDKDSQGLILLTNDGDAVNRVLRAGNEHEKEYLVTVDRPVTDEFVRGMAGGVPILGTRTKACRVERVSEHVFRIVLVQGLNRQIRRMCEHFGYEVRKLVRTRIMHIELGALAEGDWRDLTTAESEELARRIAHSSGTAPARPGDGGRPSGRSGDGARPKGGAPRPGGGAPKAGRSAGAGGAAAASGGGGARRAGGSTPTRAGGASPKRGAAPGGTPRGGGGGGPRRGGRR